MKKITILILVLMWAATAVEAQEQNEEQALEFKRNNIHFVMSDIIFKRVSFEFEHIIGEEGKISIKIPVSYNFGDANANYKSMQNTQFQMIEFKHMVDFTDWYIGLGANFYPTGQGLFRFYLGTEIRMGPAHRYPDAYYYDYYYYDWDGGEDEEPVYEEQTYLQTTFLVNVGIAFQPVDELVFSLNVSAGLKSSIDNQVAPFILPVFRMGYKF